VDGRLYLLANTVFLNGGLLTGRGEIDASVVNAAELRPGDSPGTLTIFGNYTQTADGVLDIEIGGPAAGQYDRLVINGTASLAGTLNVIILNGYRPDAGASFGVLTFHSHSGDFDAENGLDLGGGLTLVPVYAGDDTGLSLVATQSG
jgi:outer membrane autotransporter protein